ncbi:MAG: phage tail protein [Aeromonas sp.]
MISDFLAGFAKGISSETYSSPEPIVMMDLGGLRFGAATQEYQSLRSAMSWRWEEKARYGRAPALQFQGPSAITKTLAITIIAEKALDLEFLPLVQQLADQGQPLRLVAGHSKPIGSVDAIAGGSYLGLWCITSLDVEESEFLRNGTAILYKASLTIKSYGEDKA